MTIYCPVRGEVALAKIRKQKNRNNLYLFFQGVRLAAFRYYLIPWY